MTTITIIDAICAALPEPRVFWNPRSKTQERLCERLIHKLRSIKTFLLCSRKLDRVASLEQFLAQIARVAEELPEEVPEMHTRAGWRVLERYSKRTESLGEEMDQWYVTMLQCTYTPHSTSLTSNEILEILALVLESIANLIEDRDPLAVQIMFLRSLIHFVTMGGVEARKDLVAHSETIAINLAYVLFQGVYKYSQYSNDYGEKMMSIVLPIVQKIKPVDPQVYEAYTQSLVGISVSKQFPTDDDALLAVKNFLDALVSSLAEIMRLGTCYVSWMQELYERVRSLRIIFKQQPITSFVIHIQEEIADVVTDIGILVCSLTYQPQVGVNFGHQNLLEKLELVMSKLVPTVPQKPMFDSPRTSSYGFIEFIVEKLRDFNNSEAETTSKNHFQTIQEELASIRTTLGKVVGLRDEHGEFQTLWNRILEVAFKVENAIDYQVVYPLSDPSSLSLDSICLEIGNIKADLLKTEVKEERSKTYSLLPSQKNPTLNEVVGFQDEEKDVLDRLRRGSQHLRVIAIVGMPGLGKTTLAKKVYDHSSLSQYFPAKAWCTVSQVMDKKNVLCDLLKQICPDVSSNMSEDDIANELRRSLKGKRYLIFLDDIWNAESWNDLKGSFPNDTKGSRIILTSRSLDVAPREMLDKEPLLLRPLSEEDGMKLMCIKLFPGQGKAFPRALYDLGMQIVAKCGGLPLAIIIVAGILANAEAEAWEEIMGSFNFLSSEISFRQTLEFSYKHLPYYLRPCFLYFGAFPEDQEISVWRLLRLWIAEGFIRKSEANSLEDVAEGYLNMLIGRSLIVDVKPSRDGGVKTCRIHDLLRDFCLEKAKDEHFFHFAKGSSELYSLNEQPHRRLFIDCEPEALRASKIYCPHARSLLLRGSEQVYQGMSPVLQFFKLLKVLDLEQIDVGCVFPCALQQLVMLAFLALKGCKFTIPLWLANLPNLETLLISIKDHGFSLPDNVCNMQKIRYICIQSLGHPNHGGGVFPTDNLDDSSVLYELETFIGAIFDWCNMEKQLRKFPNIRRLKCILEVKKTDRGEDGNKLVFPESLGKLESLDMGSTGYVFSIRVGFEFASLRNLKKLKLSELYLYWEIFTVIGNQLQSIEVLKLHNLKFEDGEEYTWEMKGGEFSKLKSLSLSSLPLRRLIACDDHDFDCFQELKLAYCYDLVELPSCLDSIETLEMIRVSCCSRTVEGLVAKIEEEQVNWGNTGLKVYMRR